MNRTSQMIYPISENKILSSLRSFINNIYYINNLGKNGVSLMNNVEPNGMIKLVLPIKSDIIVTHNKSKLIVSKGCLAIAGVFDSTFYIEASHICNIQAAVIEFSPIFGYRFLKFSQSQLVNKICLLKEALNLPILELEKQLSQTSDIDDKLKILQKFLIQSLLKTESDTIFEFCLQYINEHFNSVTIKTLEKLTGYSSRWINHKFQTNLGVSAKTFITIARFQNEFQSLANHFVKSSVLKTYLDRYYDQSHFIKNFKRFSGLTPNKFLKIINPSQK